MKTAYNIYCDETCHLPHDHHSAMGLGAIWCARDDAALLSKEILALKALHNAQGELKWTKVSPARLPFYLALVDWFFNDPRVCYRKILSPDSRYAIYLDVKDTQSRHRVKKLYEVLCNDAFDFTGEMVESAQNIQSHESALMQLCDFLTGALGYKHRGLNSSAAKNAVVQSIETHLKRSLLVSSAATERKFNVFVFTPRVVAA